jgi:hypothetical protein
MQGGKRTGTGRKPIHEDLRKESITIQIPKWLVNRYGGNTGFREFIYSKLPKRPKKHEID